MYNKQLFYTFICIILISKLFATQFHVKYVMFPHVNIRYTYNSNVNWKYYKAKYNGVGYLLNKYIEAKIDAGLLEDKIFEIKFTPHLFESTELSRGKNGYYMSFYWHPTFLEFIRYIDYFTSENWESICNTKNYHNENYEKYARRILNKRINKYTELSDSTQFSEEVKVWSDSSISINYSLKKGMFYRLNNKILDLVVSPVFPKYYKGFVLFVNSDLNGVSVYKNNELINVSSFDTGHLSRDLKFEFQKNIVLLKGNSFIYLKYDIENNTFIEIDHEEIDYKLFKKK